jgi:Domain of Unknown Function (DUF1206)
MSIAAPVRHAQQNARRAADSDWVDWGARIGLTARGVVYLLIGFIALQVAWGDGSGEHANKEGALREVAERSWGGVLLVALVVGLASYALWRATEAVWGHRDEDDERKRTAKRLGSAGRAVFYGAFCVTTVRFILDGPGAASAGEEDEKTFVARTLELPAGQWIVSGAGAAIIAGAVYIGYRGLSGKFEKRLDTSEMGPAMGRTVDVLGTVGLVARSLVFALAGYLLIKAAIDFDPDQASGLDGTLKTMARQPFGQLLLTVTAVGLMAYGLYSWAEARYRRL